MMNNPTASFKSPNRRQPHIKHNMLGSLSSLITIAGMNDPEGLGLGTTADFASF